MKWIFAPLLISFTSFTHAAVLYTDDSRSFISDGSDPYGGSYHNVSIPDTPFADWNPLPAYASTLSSNGFSAFGSGDAYSNYDWYSSEARFDISFTLTGASVFELSGQLYGSDYWYGSGDASLVFSSGGVTLFEDSVSAQFGNTSSPYGEELSNFFYSALLSAGDYRIVATANPYFQEAYSSYSLTATFTPVPIPAAIWFFGSGMLGLIGIARRKKAAQ